MRIIFSLLVIVSFSLPAILEAEGKKTVGPKEKKMEMACKRSEVAGLVLEVCAPGKSNAGTALVCAITVTNTAKETVAYLYTTDLRSFVLEIKDSKGTVVPYSRYGKTVFEGRDLRFIDKKLEPGNGFTVEYDLSRCFDLSLAGDYSLSAVSRQPLVKGMKISIDSLRFSVKDP